MSIVAVIVGWAAVAVFVAACLYRIRMYSKLPMHVRWELYPVAHEGGGRAKYGGSYLENEQWWSKPRETSKLQEVKAMGTEIAFLEALREHNPKMWLRSFPFHFGLYLCIAAAGLLVFIGLSGAIGGIQVLANGFFEFLWLVASIAGIAGMALTLGGSIGLLVQRLTSPDLKDFTAPADIFNLVAFIVAMGIGLLVVFTGKGGAYLAITYATISFQPGMLAGPGLFLPFVSVILFALLMAYIPMTHMSHFIGKYFAYHSIRWNDEPNLRGGDKEAEIQETLGRKVSWSADHIRSDGSKSWAEVAMDVPTSEKK